MAELALVSVGARATLLELAAHLDDGMAFFVVLHSWVAVLLRWILDLALVVVLVVVVTIVGNFVADRWKSLLATGASLRALFRLR